MNVEDRLTELETRIAYQDDTIAQLNDAVCEQQLRIDKLEAAGRIMIDRIGELAEATHQGAPGDEKPPHY